MTNATTETSDTRPRHDFVLPNGEIVAVIFDHHDYIPASVTFTLKSGQVVWAKRVSQ